MSEESGCMSFFMTNKYNSCPHTKADRRSAAVNQTYTFKWMSCLLHLPAAAKFGLVVNDSVRRKQTKKSSDKELPTNC